jgi:hypothetical protein
MLKDEIKKILFRKIKKIESTWINLLNWQVMDEDKYIEKKIKKL